VARQQASEAQLTMLHIRVEEARALLSADANGLSDPYCKFNMKGTKYKTKTKPKTLHPEWNKTFDIPCAEKDLPTSIEFIVMDEDVVGKNDFLGAHIFKLHGLKDKPISGWFPLRNKDGVEDMPRGQIRVRMFYNGKAESLPEIKSSKNKSMQVFRTMTLAELDAHEDKNLDVFVGTWNVGNAPPPADLSPWIPKNKYTVYVIGAQECKYKFREQYQSCEEDWEATLYTHLGPEYALLKSKSLGQMRLVVFARKKESSKFMNFETATEATGIGHVMSNKGGVAISFSYNDTSICFINAHLAAHQHKVARRNSDVNEIMNGISRTLGKLKVDVMCEFDHVIFMGDLNYRLDYGNQGEEKTPSLEQFKQMVQKIEQKKYDQLFSCDQLQLEKKKGRVFCGFKEGLYNFAPTFKVLRQKELAYNHERSPSWCDRVLWHSLTKDWIEQVELGGAFDIASSDHKPVYTVLRLPTYHLPSLVDETVLSIRLSLDQVKCFRLPPMDQNGLADPFLQLIGTWFPQSSKNQSTVVKKTLNPVFHGIPDIKSGISNPLRLMYNNLVIKVCDKDVMSSSTIGYTILPLRWFLPENGKAQRTKMFRHHLMKGGVYVGSAVIQGQVTITIERGE